MAHIIQIRLSGGRWTKYSFQLRIDALHEYAHQFFRAAQKTGSPLVRSYLCGHALELFLKAYLFGRGMTDSQARAFGHDIAKLLEEAVKKGFDRHFRISSRLKSEILEFSSLYKSKTLEYFSLLHLLRSPKLPDMSRLFRFVASLDHKLPKVIASDTP
jgi:hypothetical protein